MTNQAITFDQASAQLSQAFSTLEQAIRARKASAVTGESDTDWQVQCEALQIELDDLRDENAHLRNQFHELQQDYLTLQQMNEQIAGQIDMQVSQLELLAQ